MKDMILEVPVSNEVPIMGYTFNEQHDEIITDYNDMVEENMIHLKNKKKEPVINENKIGRNEPCPCGSGKKYKYCCGK